MDVTDAIFTLRYLFQGAATPSCLDAEDADDDGKLALTDALVTVRFLFQGGAAPPAPYPEIGADTTEDAIDCAFGVE